MPTYEYACKDCGSHLEVVQSFTDDALTECPSCKGRLRKVFGAVGIAFKGSGFYKNDSRSSSKASSSASSSSDTSTSTSTKSEGGDGKSDATPAKSETKESGSSPAASTTSNTDKAAS